MTPKQEVIKNKLIQRIVYINCWLGDREWNPLILFLKMFLGICGVAIYFGLCAITLLPLRLLIDLLFGMDMNALIGILTFLAFAATGCWIITIAITTIFLFVIYLPNEVEDMEYRMRRDGLIK